jgi:hypothetical protein
MEGGGRVECWRLHTLLDLCYSIDVGNADTFRNSLYIANFPLGTLVAGSSIHHVQKGLDAVVKCK